MLRWLFSGETRSFDAPSESQSARDDRKTVLCGDNYVLYDLIVSEVEMVVVRFEVEKEEKAEELRKAERRPDYSWLITAPSKKVRKHLTIHEKNRIENACERLQPSELARTLETWKMKTQDPPTREDIVDQFVLSAHEMIQSRKHEPTVSEVIRNFATGRAASFHSVRHGESPRESPQSRNIAELSFIELQEMV